MALIKLIVAALVITLGAAVGWLLPRLTWLIPGRLMSTRNLPAYPLPVPIDDHLLRRLSAMDEIWRQAGIIALLLCAMFGFGLWSLGGGFLLGGFVTSGWTAVARLMGLEPRPWTTEMARQLKAIAEADDIECCDDPDMVWAHDSVRCSGCGTKHLDMPRPALGRQRPDGVMGFVRVLLDDGHPHQESSVDGSN